MICFGKATYKGNEILYVSKCKRFTILRREYCLPHTSIGYVLIDTTDGSRTDCDSLKEAKEYAKALAETEGAEMKTQMFDARQVRDFVKAAKRETGGAWNMFGGRIQEALLSEYALGVLGGQASESIATETINELRYAMLVEAGLRDPKEPIRVLDETRGVPLRAIDGVPLRRPCAWQSRQR